VQYRRLYLSAAHSGSARSMYDGSLVDDPPASAFAQTAQLNPLSGLCTRSTTQWSAGIFPPVGDCETDNRFQELGALTYTTAPAQQALHVEGPIGLTLQGSTNAGDAIWTAVLTDVAAGGRSTQVTGGWLLSSRRAIDPRRTLVAPNGDLVAPYHPFTKAELLPVHAGQTYTLNFEIFGTDAVIKPGHRLRLVITSGDTPHLAPMGTSVIETLGAVTTVHSSPAAPSFLTLPVAGGPLPARQPHGAKHRKRHGHRKHH
jgi:putative CocE/NonD family hydrolase